MSTAKAHHARVKEQHFAGAPRSVMRLLRVFETIAAAREGNTLAQLSVRLAAPKSSLLMLLRPLVASGYLLHVDSRYRLGAAAYRLAADILSTRDLNQLMRPYMEDLVSRSRESVFLATLDRETRLVVYADRIDSPQAIRYSAPVGTMRPLYCSAAGLVLLAFQDDEWRERYLRTTQIKPLTPHTVIGKTAIRRNLERIRAEGLAVSIGEAVPGVGGVAAPIVNADGSVSAALLVAAPAERLQSELPGLRRLVKEVARRASSGLRAAAARATQ
ncbi:MAG: IclR family transcriptional regulator [Betaproteobacteria bacterium]|nr:MAG: IclR family transcriptional regulator [Betaproteobacteria bacterium]RPI48381.1 MAG: IclR family transcriptional regulator [Betaproteobacteria bacterium]